MVNGAIYLISSCEFL